MRRRYQRETRTPQIEGDIAYVPLTRGLYAKIDATDASKVSSWNWRASIAGRANKPYAIRTTGKRKEKRNIYMHVVIHGAPKVGSVVDHINGDSIDNRRANLRFATKKQNRRNCGPMKPGKRKGVYRQNTGRYLATICLGEFETEDAAYQEYRRVEKLLFGEFAHIEKSPDAEAPGLKDFT